MRTVVVACGAALIGGNLAAEPPKLDSIFPPGGQRGVDVAVEFGGKFEPWPTQVTFFRDGLTFTPDPEKPGTGTITIAKDVEVGPVLVRASNPDGVSPPVFFVVDDRAEHREGERQGSGVAHAQVLEDAALPLVINGTLSSNHEFDAYRFAMEKGETLHVAVEGYTLRSPVDPALHVYDEEGRRLALAHDGAVHLDPVFAFTAPASGNYTVAVTGFAHPPASTVYFRGGKTTHYRFHVASKRKDLPGRLLPRHLDRDSPPGKVELGETRTGTLSEGGEVDRFLLPLEKGNRVVARIDAYSLRYPTDVVLRIRKPDGSELRVVDDFEKKRDPECTWTAAVDGEHAIEVSERMGRGGRDMRYRLSVSEPVPDFTARVDKSEYVVKPGEEVAVKVTVGKRQGNEEELALAWEGLPETVTVTPPDSIPAKGGDVTVTLTAAKTAEPFQGKWTLRVTEKGEDGGGERRKSAVFSFQDDNARGPYLIEETSDLWLTIPPVVEDGAEEEKVEKE